ncbi:hypothetical protein MWU59_07495 [Flavobacteriaceae bacterium F08102]|nr:hypothetical protein [Flavobacteriaceae bacterium F08102]
MELSRIEKLLEKYDNATTSLQEEQELKDFFSQKEIPAHLVSYQAMFGYFQENSNEQFTKTILLSKRKAPHWKWLSVAAAAALLISVYTFTNNELSSKEREQAQLAMQQTKDAFLLLSKNLNKGSNLVYSGLQEFDNATSKVFK